MIVADTDVLIDFLSGHGPGAKRLPLEFRQGQLHTTGVNQFELLAGARSPKQEAIIRSLLDAMATLSLDEHAADQAARIRRDLERQGSTDWHGQQLDRWHRNFKQRDLADTESPPFGARFKN